MAASGKSQKSFGFLTFSWGIEIEHEVKWVKFSEKLLLQTLCFISSHRSCSVKNVFLEIVQNSQESTCARVSFLIKN